MAQHRVAWHCNTDCRLQCWRRLSAWLAFCQVRDRATLYLAELDGKAGGLEAVDVQWDIPARNLEKSLRAYLDNGAEAPFDLVRPGPREGSADGKTLAAHVGSLAASTLAHAGALGMSSLASTHFVL